MFSFRRRSVSEVASCRAVTAHCWRRAVLILILASETNRADRRQRSELPSCYTKETINFSVMFSFRRRSVSEVASCRAVTAHCWRRAVLILILASETNRADRRQRSELLSCYTKETINLGVMLKFRCRSINEVASSRTILAHC